MSLQRNKLSRLQVQVLAAVAATSSGTRFSSKDCAKSRGIQAPRVTEVLTRLCVLKYVKKVRNLGEHPWYSVTDLGNKELYREIALWASIVDDVIEARRRSSVQGLVGQWAYGFHNEVSVQWEHRQKVIGSFKITYDPHSGLQLVDGNSYYVEDETLRPNTAWNSKFVGVKGNEIFVWYSCEKTEYTSTADNFESVMKLRFTPPEYSVLFGRIQDMTRPKGMDTGNGGIRAVKYSPEAKWEMVAKEVLRISSLERERSSNV